MKLAIAKVPRFRTFEELRAWQLCAELRDGVLAFCEHPALAQEFTAIQLRGSSRFAPRLIPEGSLSSWGSKARAISPWFEPELLRVQNDLLELRGRKGLAEEAERLRLIADHAARVTALLRSSLSNE